MHLRLKSPLATERALRRLRAQLEKLAGKGDTCVFAGAMPAGALLSQVVELVRRCHDLGARVVVDSHGEALKGLVDGSLPWLITPNVEELRELLGRDVRDAPAPLVKAGRRLLGRSQAVLISRGAPGAVLVTQNGAWTGRAEGRGRVVSTVGCGDYLLAGFLAGCARSLDPRAALALALEVATARARGWTETLSWPEAHHGIEVTVEAV
jgi:fructose-1-phosphate kinase PfkB-like protein